MRSWLNALLILLLSTSPAASEPFGAPPSNTSYFLDALVASYPDHLADHDGTQLLWRDATLMPVSDGKNNKTFKQLLNNPDIDDMFAFSYAVNTEATAPAVKS